MPFAHGKSTQVLLGGLDLSSYLQAASTSVEVDTADTTTFASTWKSAISGTAGLKADLQGLYDPTLVAVRNLIDSGGGVLSVIPNGAGAIGSPIRLVPVASTSYAESSPVGGVIGFKWSVIAADRAGLGWTLHPLAEDTNTTTGADRDDTAATSTGWNAHLHVTAVDAGSWVIRLQDALTTDWTDVTGGAFTAATGATGQRLQSAAGATLRRHVRYIATRTGGTAGDGITFALAYARN
jgi:hypothetical protein